MTVKLHKLDVGATGCTHPGSDLKCGFANSQFSCLENHASRGSTRENLLTNYRMKNSLYRDEFRKSLWLLLKANSLEHNDIVNRRTLVLAYPSSKAEHHKVPRYPF